MNNTVTFNDYQLARLYDAFDIAYNQIACKGIIYVPINKLVVIHDAMNCVLSNDMESITQEAWQLMIKLIDDSGDYIQRLNNDAIQKRDSEAENSLSFMLVEMKASSHDLKEAFLSYLPGKKLYNDGIRTNSAIYKPDTTYQVEYNKNFIISNNASLLKSKIDSAEEYKSFFQASTLIETLEKSTPEYEAFLALTPVALRDYIESLYEICDVVDSTFEKLQTYKPNDSSKDIVPRFYPDKPLRLILKEDIIKMFGWLKASVKKEDSKSITFINTVLNEQFDMSDFDIPFEKPEFNIATYVLEYDKCLANHCVNDGEDIAQYGFPKFSSQFIFLLLVFGDMFDGFVFNGSNSTLGYNARKLLDEFAEMYRAMINPFEEYCRERREQMEAEMVKEQAEAALSFIKSPTINRNYFNDAAITKTFQTYLQSYRKYNSLIGHKNHTDIFADEILQIALVGIYWAESRFFNQLLDGSGVGSHNITRKNMDLCMNASKACFNSMTSTFFPLITQDQITEAYKKYGYGGWYGYYSDEYTLTLDSLNKAASYYNDDNFNEIIAFYFCVLCKFIGADPDNEAVKETFSNGVQDLINTLKLAVYSFAYKYSGGSDFLYAREILEKVQHTIEKGARNNLWQPIREDLFVNYLVAIIKNNDDSLCDENLDLLATLICMQLDRTMDKEGDNALSINDKFNEIIKIKVHGDEFSWFSSYWGKIHCKRTKEEYERFKKAYIDFVNDYKEVTYESLPSFHGDYSNVDPIRKAESICLDINITDQTLNLTKKTNRELRDCLDINPRESVAIYEQNAEKLVYYISGEKQCIDVIATAISVLGNYKRNKPLTDVTANIYAQKIYSIYKDYRIAIECDVVTDYFRIQTDKWDCLKTEIGKFIDDLQAIGNNTADKDSWNDLAVLIRFFIGELKYSSRKGGYAYSNDIHLKNIPNDDVEGYINALNVLLSYITNGYKAVFRRRLSKEEFVINHSIDKLFTDSDYRNGDFKPYDFVVFPEVLEKVKAKCPDYNKRLNAYGKVPKTSLVDDAVLYCLIQKIKEMRKIGTRLYYCSEEIPYWAEHPGYLRLINNVYNTDNITKKNRIKYDGHSSVVDYYDYSGFTPYELISLIAIAEWFIFNYEDKGLSSSDCSGIGQMRNAIDVIKKLLESIV